MCAMRVILIGVERPLPTMQICIAGFCLGLVPFAKIQAAIIAAAMGLVFFLWVVRQSKQPYRSGSLLLFSASLPGSYCYCRLPSRVNCLIFGQAMLNSR